MNPEILVTGAPGNVGTYVVEGLQAQGVPFRVAAWDVKEAQRQLGNQLDIVHFDFLDAATYAQAFAGIKRLFLIRPPQLAHVQKEIAPAINAAITAGVEHIVFLSLQGVEQNRVTPHYKIEKLIRESPVQYTFLRASFFMQNLSTTHVAEIRDSDEIALPVGKARTSFIDTRDIAAVTVRVLTEHGHTNKAYTLTGNEALDYAKVASIMSEVLQRPIQYTNPSIIAFMRRQLATGRKLGYTLVMTALYTITRFGNAEQVSDDVAQILQRPPISLRQFVVDNRTYWMPQPSA
jgi:uncharacterized protein YbjT (DUF2867 family)